MTTTGVRINIEDVNDNLPRFEQDDYARVIEEGADHFEPPLIIKATDLDGPNQVEYSWIFISHQTWIPFFCV